MAVEAVEDLNIEIEDPVPTQKQEVKQESVFNTTSFKSSV